MAKPHDHTDTQSAEGGAPKDEGLEYPGAVPVAADELDVITGKDLDRQRAKSRKGRVPARRARTRRTPSRAALAPSGRCAPRRSAARRLTTR